MSNEPNVTSESSDAATAALTTPPGDAHKAKAPAVGRYWWIPVAFLVPAVAIYEWLGNAGHLNLSACFRSGAIGLGVAAFIYSLWLIDKRLQRQPEKPVGPLIGMLGMMLWLGWVVAVHVMVIAYDDAYYRADSEMH